MRRKRLHTELSAHLDGQAGDPRDIERRIQSDPGAAQRHVEYAKISARLKGLQPPEVSPAFATRVMASVMAAEETRRPARHWLWVAASAMTAALILAGIGIGLRAYSPETAPPETSRWAAVEPDAVMELIASRIESDPAAIEQAASIYTVPSYSDVAAAPGDSVEPWLEAFASEQWFEALEESVARRQDIDGLLESMDEEETQAFRQLLVAYAQGEISI